MALSYVNPSKNHYSYRLKGVDKEWVENTVNNIASYTNLAPGEYMFEVRGSNNDNRWNEKTTKLLIVITPPWWRTNLAYFFYLVLFLGTAYYAAWSQKYNMVWDKLWNMSLFPNNAITKEIDYYLTKQNAYGLPLDSRRDYTKSDWIMWTAAMSPDKSIFEKFVEPFYKYINETTSRVPISDWHG